MSEDIPYLMIGTYGWDENKWAEHYYDPDMPKEWRFLTYSGHYRSVLVPHTFLHKTDTAVIKQWLEECDNEFRFILELSETVLGPQSNKKNFESVLTQFFEKAQSMKGYVAGYTLRAESAGSVETWLPAILPKFNDKRLCTVAIPDSKLDADINKLLQQHHVGLCWFADVEPRLPENVEHMVVAITETTEPKKIRGIIEQLAPVLNSRRQAALFFQGDNAAEVAWQARVIADLLVV